MHSGPEDIARAVRRLREGGLVAFPTETVYGLGADALDEVAVRSVFEAKGRPPSNPLIVHVVDESMARSVCASWPEQASTLAKAHWPGPLTLVLPKSPAVPSVVTAGGETVAVRCPSHPLTLALIEAYGSPLVGPSANRSGCVSPTAADHVRESFGEDEVLVLDGGPCVGGIESTVLDLTGPVAVVLRPGLLTPDELAETLGSAVRAADPTDEAEEIARSPGHTGAHYAPAAPARLVSPSGLGAMLTHAEPGAVVVSPEPPPDGRAHVGMPDDPRSYAARLYAALREADAGGPPEILVVTPWGDGEPEGLWISIADRLRRACSEGPAD